MNTTLNLAEAIKKFDATKAKDNYLVVTFGYDNKLVFPYKTGLAFIAALNEAEKLTEPYSSPPSLTNISRDEVQINIMSYQDHRRYGLAAFLDTTVDRIKEMEQAQLAENRL